MTYVVQTWSDNDPRYPVSAARMQHIESGLDLIANKGAVSILPSGDATGATDTAALVAAAGAGVNVQLGKAPSSAPYFLNALATIPDGCDINGLGGGKTTGAATYIKCVAASAGIAFGTRTASSRGGKSGGFVIDGNSVATQPYYEGQCVQRTFEDITVRNSAGVGATFEATQNCRHFGFDVEDCTSDGMLFDYGAGNLLFEGSEIRNNGSNGHGNVRFQESGTAPSGAFSDPTNIRFVGGGGAFDPPASGATYNIYHGAGRGNAILDYDISWTGLAAGASVVVMRRDSASFPSDLFRIGNSDIQGTAAEAVLFDLLGSGGNGVGLILEGYCYVLNAQTLFSVDDISTVDIEGVINDWSSAGITTYFANAGGGTKSWYQLIRHRRRSNMLIVPQATTDIMVDVALNGEAKSRLTIRGDGQLAWSDGTNAGATLSQSTAAGSVQSLLASGPIKIQGTTAVVAAGTGAPATNFANGSIWLRTDGGAATTIYQRVNGQWVELAPNSRADVYATARGYGGWNFPPELAQAQLQPASGDVRYSLLPFRAGDVVTNLITTVDVAGTSMTHAQFGLYTTGGTLLASTGDTAGDRTAFQSAQECVIALSSPYTIAFADLGNAVEGGLYVGLFLTSTGTMPKILRGWSAASGTAEWAGVGSGKPAYYIQTGQASLPSPATLSSIPAASGIYGWS